MTRTCGCVVLLITLMGAFVWGQQAAPANDTQAEAAFQQGRQLFDAGRYEEAVVALRAAFQEHPDHVGINFYLGRATFELGDYETPVMAFERVLMLDPSLTRAKLELARSYFRLGVHDIARSYFQQVLDTGPPLPVKRRVEGFINKIKTQDRSHFFSGRLTLALHFDSNPRVSPETSEIQLGKISWDVGDEESDALSSITLGVDHRYSVPDSPWGWQSSATTYSAFYLDQVDLDVNFFSLASGPTIESDRAFVALQGVYELLDKEHDDYLRSAGIQLNALVGITPHVYLALGAKGMQKDYRQSPQRESFDLVLGGGPIVSWGANRVTTRLNYETEEAWGGGSFAEDEQSFDRFQTSLRYDRRLSKALSCFASHRYQMVGYDERYATFDTDRRDQIHDLTLGLSRRLRDRYMVEVSHTFTRARSTIELYQYSRHVTSLSLSVTF